MVLQHDTNAKRTINEGAADSKMQIVTQTSATHEFCIFQNIVFKTMHGAAARASFSRTCKF